MRLLRLSLTAPLRRSGRALAIAGLAIVLGACGERDMSGTQQPGGAPPPPEVGVVTVQPSAVALTSELPGRLEPIRVAQVRARVTGILQKREFTEGSNVKAGQVLYRIDPAPYEAALESARAQQAQAEAALADASARAARFKPLVAANAVSKQEYDAAVAAAKAAQAQVAAGKAAVRTASINLGYATVTAPIDGHIGRSLVTEGALVSQTEATQLATIQQTDMLYLNITQSASAVLRMREALRQGKLENAEGREAARVDVLLENGELYPHAGRLLFTDLTVDPGTGQVQLRAEVPNPDGMLLPGMYVRARLEQAKLDGIFLLPLQAVTRGSQGDSVLVVDADGSIAPRQVTVEGQHDRHWIITGGLEPGEQVMVDGQMRVAMGASTVKPVPWQPASDSGSTGGAPTDAAQPRGEPGQASSDDAPAR